MASLVEDYGSDDEEETDDEEQDQVADETVPKKRRKIGSLPLPPALHPGPSQDSRVQDHQGRVRSFPHVEGQWATYVYLPGI